jgi:hypothetical protein
MKLSRQSSAVADAAVFRQVAHVLRSHFHTHGHLCKPPLEISKGDLAYWRKRWEKVRPDESEFVRSLNHNIEGDGFGRPNPVTPDLMARRSKLWTHPIVEQIIRDAPTKQLPMKTALHECKSFQSGRPGKSSDNCAPEHARVLEQPARWLQGVGSVDPREVSLDMNRHFQALRFRTCNRPGRLRSSPATLRMKLRSRQSCQSRSQAASPS